MEYQHGRKPCSLAAILNDMNKLSVFVLFLFLAGQVTAQQSTRFEFWVSSLDKAAFKRITYHINEDSVIIKNGPYDFLYFAKEYMKDEIVYKRKLDSSDRKKLHELAELLKASPIKALYNNLCIIDGMILHFHFEWGSTIKATTISTYYLATMTPVVAFVNSLASKKYEIWYDKDWLMKVMKDCTQNKILDKNSSQHWFGAMAA